METKMQSDAGRKRWFSTGFMAGGVASVDAEKHTLHGAVMIRPGEALGHDLWIDRQFCDTVATLANGTGDKGLKARFGHPNMCSDALGTFLGRWKGIAVDAAGRLSGDLFLSSTAADSPRGDLRKYVEEMAAKEPEHFGASVVFTRDEESENEFLQQNGFGTDTGFHSPDPQNARNLPHARLSELHAADLVDDPAATDGMFSGAGGASLAAEMTEWLDTHPEVFKAINADPGMLAMVERYADELRPFLARYSENFGKNRTLAAGDATCPKCGHVFNYAAQPEKGMGVVACPKCGADVTQADCECERKPAAAELATATTTTTGDVPAESGPTQADVDALTAQVNAGRMEIERLTVERDGLTKRAETAEAEVKTLTVARDELAARATKAEGERDDWAKRFAVLEAGPKPASAAPAERKNAADDAWQQAKRAGSKR